MIESYQTALIELIKCSLFGYKPVFPDDTDWDKVLSEAKAQTVVALAQPAVPNEYKADWVAPAAESTAHFIRALFEQSNTIKLFKNNNIPMVIIKGCAAAVYYPQPQFRTMGDIDILVPPGNFTAARNVLEQNGYTFCSDNGDDRDYVFTKGNVVFELHRKYSDRILDIEHLITNEIKNPQTLEIMGNAFPTFPDGQNALILIDHIRHHLLGGLGMRQIIDWMMFVNAKINDYEFYSYYSPIIKKAGLLKFAKIVTKMCKLHFGLNAPITWCDDADAQTAHELFLTVLNSGNFGVKKPYVYKPMASLALGINKRGLFKTLQLSGIKNFPICSKYPFLRPFAWLFQVFRFVIRGIAALFKGGSLKGDFKEGKKQSDFYNRLGIK